MDPQMNKLGDRLRNLTPEQRAMLAQKLRQSAAKGSAAPAAAEALPEPDLGLSPSQQRMWLFEKIEGSSSAYNVVSALHLRGALDVEALEFAFNQLVRRHEILRTRFVELEGVATQAIEPSLEIEVRRVDARHLRFEGDQERVLELVAEEIDVDFRLDTLPLLKVSALSLADDETVLICIIHHILADGWSLRLLEREISDEYRAFVEGRRAPAEARGLQYRHYVGRQKEWLESAGARAQAAYWGERLDGSAPPLALPLEAPRALAPSLASESAIFAVPEELRERLDAFAQAHSTSLFMVLATAFKLTLSYFTGSEDISVGTPVANRRERRFEDVIGLFSNTVVLRAAFPAGCSFANSLERVRQAALDAYSNQDLPFEQVVDAVRPERSAASTPLFQVLFALQSVESSALALPGLEVAPVQLQRPSIEFDIIFECFFEEGANHCVLSYRTERLARPTVERMRDCFLALLDRGCRTPDAPLAELVGAFGAEAAAGSADAAEFLADAADLRAGDVLLVERGLPADIVSAAVGAAERLGAKLCWAEADDLASGAAIAARIAGTGASWLLLAPGGAAACALACMGDPILDGQVRLVAVHGGLGDMRPMGIEERTAEVWSLPEAGGPFLVRRGDSGDAAASRGRLAAINATGLVLPEDVIGELAVADAAGRLLPTGLRGRIRAAKVLLARQERSCWVAGARVDPATVERLLLEHPSIADAVVAPRRDSNGLNRLVAYVAVNQRVGEEALAAWLRPRLDGAAMPLIVLVSAIPLTRHGATDLAALEALPAVAAGAVAADGAAELDWSPPAQGRIALRGDEDGASLDTPPPAAKATVAEARHAALAVGAPLADLDIDLTLPAVLRRAATMHSERGLLHIRDSAGATTRQSYADLAADASRILAGLRSDGIHPGERILLQLADNRDFLAGFWACAIGGFLPVMAGVPEAYDVEHKDTAKILNAWDALGVARILCSGDKAPALRALGEAADRRLACLTIEAMRGHEAASDWHSPAPGDAAILLLTSGSTGVPKAVIQSHAALVRRSAATAQQFGFDETVVSFNWMPLDHVGGVVMFHLLDTYLGAEQIHCPTPIVLADPLRWLDWLDQYRVTNSWAPNFGYALVNDRLEQRPDAGWDLSSVAFLLNGGEAIVPRTARSFLSRLARHGLSGSAMVPAWGMSETCSGVTLNPRFDLGSTSDEDSFVDVGPPIPGVEIRIVNGSGRLVDEGQVGALQIRGATVTGGYFNNPSATEQAFTADGWFVTGDLAMLRDRSLTITGREKDLIIINGLNYFGHEVEQVVEEVPGILEAHVAACGVRRAKDETDRLAIFYSAAAPGIPGDLARAIRRIVLERMGIVPSYIVPMEPDALPRTSIGKIERARLADRFNRGDFDALLDGGAADRDSPALPCWFFEPAWVPRARGGRAESDAEILLIGPQSPFVAGLAEAMRWDGARVTATDEVESPDFAQTLHSLAGSGVRELRIVHCGACGTAADAARLLADPDGALRPGLLSVAAMARLLADAPPAIAVSVDIVTSDAQAALASDRPQPAHAALTGFLRSLGQEMPGLRVRHIDVQADAPIDELLLELASERRDDSVALRGRRRLVPRLAPASLGRQPLLPRRFQAEGFHIVTGGLGGIGRLVVEMLLKTPEARVLVIGRSDPESCSAALEAFAGHGDRFAYAARDVRDATGLSVLLNEYEALWSRPLRTVFHLAGSLSESLVRESSSASILAALEAKALGALALHAAIGEREGVETIHFGSVNGYFGGVGVAAYAAANSMIEAISLSRRADGEASRCIAFSMWDGIGMSRDYALKQQSAARGFALLDEASGIASLAVAASAPGATLLVGLDGSSPNIASRLAGPAQPLRALRGSGEARDCFGTVLPRIAAEQGGADEGAVGERRTLSEMEARLAEIWRSVLQIEVDDPEANFFELGGDSIMGIQVVSRANQQGIGLVPRQLFECQTLAALAGAAADCARAPREQEVLSGEVPLGPVQNWFFERGLANPHHFNQSVLLRVKRRLDPSVVARALEVLAGHHDLLRARYSWSDGEWRQRVEDSCTVAVEEIAIVADAVETIAAVGSEVQARLDLEAGPLLRAVYFRGSQADEDRLLIAAHHLVVDGVSWRIIQEDLEHLLQSLSEGAPPALPPRTSSYRAYVEHWRERARTELADSLPYWSHLAGRETFFPGLDEGQANDRASERSCEIELDAETTRTLLVRTTRSCGAEITDVLLAALCDGYRAWAGRDEIFLTLEGHGRSISDENVDLSRTVGWFTALFPFSLGTDARSALPARVAEVKRQRRALPEEGLSFGALRYLGGEAGAALGAVAWPRLSFNYLGRFDVGGDSLLSFAEESPGDQQGPSDLRINEIDVVGLVIDGRMKFSFNYGSRRLDRASVAAFAAAFADSLEKLAELGRADAALAAMPEAEWIGLDGASMQEVARELVERGIAGAVETAMPLTATQQGLLFDTLHGAGDGLYVSQLVNAISGDLDADALRTAWQQIVTRHAAYRTCFAGLDGVKPVQIVLRDAALPWSCHDWRAVPAAEHEAKFEALLAEDRLAGFDLGSAPLLRITLVRLADSRYRMLLSEHHAISDGWSRGLVLRELAAFYRAGIGGSDLQVPRAVSFARYVEWLGRFDEGRARDYWTGYLSGIEDAAPLAIAKTAPAQGGASSRRYRRFDAARSETIAAAARSARSTPSALVQSAWGLLLSLYTGRGDVLFGTTHSGRPAELSGVEEIVGPFINTVPVRLRLDSYATVGDCVRAVSAMQLDHAEFGHLPPLEIKRASVIVGNKPLFETLFLVENFPLAVAEAGEEGLRVDEVTSLDETGFPLMVMLVPGERYELIVYFRESHFSEAAVDGLLDRFEILLDQVAADPSMPLDGIEWLGGAERRKVVENWNDTRCPAVRPSVDRSFRLCAAEKPNSPALVQGAQVLSYGEVDERVEALARRLRARGVGPECAVGVLLDRSPEMVIALLAIWRAGGAYLPLDPVYPKARLEHMLESSGARLILSNAACRGRIDIPADVALVDVDASGEAGAQGDFPAGSPGDLAYLMYTSGSTGRPKGIAVEQGNVVNFLAAMDALFPLGEGTALLAVTSICFDISVLELFQPLVSGGTTVLASAEEALDPQHLQRLMREHRVTHMQATPATWQMLADDGWANEQNVVVLTGGDTLPEPLAQRLSARATMWNLYGPTEATVWSNAKRIVPGGGPVTLGRPIANLRCYVLDEKRRPLPPGVPGELYIAGAGVARGYVGQEELTRERFLADDVHPDAAGERMYRTGDLVRWSESGEIEFLGRIDHQVKIRGFRVEIGEIERVIAGAAGIGGAVVTATGEGSAKRLVAYLVACTEQGAAIASARAEVAERLPAYMHPAAYVVLQSFPLTQNGKIDRKALPQPEEAWVAERTSGREPSASEREVMALFTALLPSEAVDPESDFFALGGNSILAAQLSSRLRRDFGVSVPVADIFEDITVSRVAARLDALRHPPAADEETVEIHLF